MNLYGKHLERMKRIKLNESKDGEFSDNFWKKGEITKFEVETRGR